MPGTQDDLTGTTQTSFWLGKAHTLKLNNNSGVLEALNGSGGYLPLSGQRTKLYGSNASNYVGRVAPTLSASYTLTEPTALPASLVSALASDTSGNQSWHPITHAVCQGRLTTVFPTATNDGAVGDSASGGSNNLYWVPTGGGLVGLYDNTNWSIQAVSTLTINISGLTAGKVYDVFVDNTQATYTVAWTNTTTRATNLALVNSVWSLSTNSTRRWLGTVYITTVSGSPGVIDYGGAAGTGNTPSRHIWNAYNRVLKPVFVADTTTSWAYATGSFRQVNANANNQVNVVSGMAVSPIYLTTKGLANSTAAQTTAIGIGVDSTSSVLDARSSFFVSTSNYAAVSMAMCEVVPLGQHFYAACEVGATALTFYGTNGRYSSLVGWVEC